MVEVQDSSPVAQHPHPRKTAADVAVVRFRDDAAYEGPIAAFADFNADSNTAAVRVDPDNDARDLIPQLARLRLVEISFPKFRDGRGYSSARILREAGYTGEIRACGDVLLDQLLFMRRVGIDAIAPNKPINPEWVAAALARYPFVYQKAADATQPVWALRHG